MEIKRTLEKIPGGMMIVPLFLGVLLNTLLPSLLDIGGLTTALARGAAPLIGAFLFCMGAGIRLRAAPRAMKKGLVVTASKFLTGLIAGLSIAWACGDAGWLGLSSLAVISAMTNTNGGLYAALVGELGDETDVGAIAIISINDGPFLTMVALGTAGLAQIPVQALLGVILPIAAGMLVGNLDARMRVFLTQGGTVLIPFFAFALGAGLHVKDLLNAGLPGVLLGFLTTGVAGICNVLADRATGGNGICGAAASSTAGNAVATPEALALADPGLRELALAATPQVAAATLTTALLTPLLTGWVAAWNQRRQANSHR